jgi:hypothetical protein
MPTSHAMADVERSPAPANCNRPSRTAAAAGRHPVPVEPAGVDAVIAAALLVATAFRLRDEEGLTASLRVLVSTFDSFAGAARA